METDALERIERQFKRRYRIKKVVNLYVSIAITLLGISSFIYIWNYDRDGVLTFRWMTVDGTIFTTVISFAYVAVNLVELIGYTELTSKAVYYMRLASAVAESLIFSVVMLSQMPISPEHMHLFDRIDMFNMHLLIPLLTVLSFVTNDSPIGEVKPAKRLHGTWFITIYAVILITLILKGVIPQEQIPYFFLDVGHMPIMGTMGCFAFIYTLGYGLSTLLYRLNRKLSWLWFSRVAAKKSG